MLPDTQAIVQSFSRVGTLSRVPPTTSGRVALRNLTDAEVARLEPGDIILRDCGGMWTPERLKVVEVHEGIAYDRNGSPLDEPVPVAGCLVPSGVVLVFNSESLLFPSYVLPQPVPVAIPAAVAVLPPAISLETQQVHA